MTNEEAIRILDPATTRETLAEIEYYGGFNGHEAVMKAVEDACVLAVEALKRPAYDVEAVVRELEREIERDNEKERQYFIEGNERLGYCLNGKASALKLAIEIVKRGGRDE